MCVCVLAEGQAAVQLLCPSVVKQVASVVSVCRESSVRKFEHLGPINPSPLLLFFFHAFLHIQHNTVVSEVLKNLANLYLLNQIGHTATHYVLFQLSW